METLDALFRKLFNKPLYWVIENCHFSFLRVFFFSLFILFVYTLGFMLSPLAYLYDFWTKCRKDIMESFVGIWNWENTKS